MSNSQNPLKVLLFSGKRKCGKDYVTDKLLERLNWEDVALIRISGPIKSHWGKEKGLDFDLLMGSSEYKERYRRELVTWSENVRNSDYGYFCRAALDMYDAYSKKFWVVSDVRRKTDIRWFSENFPGKIRTIRLVCDDQIRVERGWKFTEGIDDKETECDLDDFDSWDFKIINNGQDLTEILNVLTAELS
uniref:Phosphomevalonate kinase n=2 Tax=Lygus hesperus TaxID=30085 RepID=A0A146KU59_LYGHE